MRQLHIPSSVVVAPGNDIRIALMLAQAAPDLVRAIFAIGAGFPILDDTQYRRLIPVARFTRTCSRYSPRVLPFLMRSMRAVISSYGLERYLHVILAGIPADARAMAESEIATAFHAGAEKLFLPSLVRSGLLRRGAAVPRRLAQGTGPCRLPGDPDPWRTGWKCTF